VLKEICGNPAHNEGHEAKAWRVAEGIWTLRCTNKTQDEPGDGHHETSGVTQYDGSWVGNGGNWVCWLVAAYIDDGGSGSEGDEYYDLQLEDEEEDEWDRNAEDNTVSDYDTAGLNCYVECGVTGGSYGDVGEAGAYGRIDPSQYGPEVYPPE
jgi:hypothetical protein